MITAMSLVTHSIREPGEYSSGTPLMQTREWRKNAARFRQLDTLARRVNARETTPRDNEDRCPHPTPCRSTSPRYDACFRTVTPSTWPLASQDIKRDPPGKPQ